MAPQRERKPIMKVPIIGPNPLMGSHTVTLPPATRVPLFSHRNTAFRDTSVVPKFVAIVIVGVGSNVETVASPRIITPFFL